MILVTGATGMTGRFVVEELQKRNYSVRVLVREADAQARKLEREAEEKAATAEKRIKTAQAQARARQRQQLGGKRFGFVGRGGRQRFADAMADIGKQTHSQNSRQKIEANVHNGLKKASLN